MKKSINMKTILMALSFVLIVLSSKAQQGVNFFRVLTEPQATIAVTPLMTESQRDAAINAATQSVVFVFELADFQSAKAHVKLGADSSSFNIYNQVINLDGTNLPSGTTVEKSGSNVRVNIGSYTGLAHYFAEIEIESAAAIKSQKYQIKH